MRSLRARQEPRDERTQRGTEGNDARVPDKPVGGLDVAAVQLQERDTRKSRKRSTDEGCRYGPGRESTT